jgi:hypothetical protein
MKRELLWGVITCIFIAGLCVFPAFAAPVDEHTKGLWLLDEGSGKVAKDSSGNGNHGEIFEAKWVEGKYGSALEFDGIGGNADYVEIPGSDSMNIRDAITMEAWVYIDNHQADNIRLFHAYTSDPGVVGGASLVIRQSGNVGGAWFRATGGFLGTTMIPLERWVHLAVTWDGSAAVLIEKSTEKCRT